MLGIGELLEVDRARELLAPAVDERSAAPLADLLVRCAGSLRERGIAATQEAAAFFVPGRIEVLGKHTDYAGGRSLLAPIDRGICLVAVPREDDRVSVADEQSSESLTFALSVELQPAGGWRNYPITVARRVTRNFAGPLNGMELAFASNLPPAAGMSSSSALVVAFFLALSAINDLSASEAYRANIGSREELADYLAAVESGADFRGLPGGQGVGTRGGSQDHTAILCGRRGELVQYRFSPVRFERAVALPSAYRLIIAVSGVSAEKTGVAMQHYNRAAEQMHRATQLWRAETGREESLGAAMRSDPHAADRMRELLREAGLSHAASLLSRVNQFIEETTVIIPAASDALARGDLTAFTKLVDRSQLLAETGLRNQVPETVFLARSARKLGAIAASAFGAGFGGSVWALVEEECTGQFLERWRSAYSERFPALRASASFFTTRPAGPAAPLA